MRVPYLQLFGFNIPIKEYVKISLGKSKNVDRDLSHVTFYLSLSPEEEGEDSAPGQTWLTFPRIKELAQQVIGVVVVHLSLLTIGYLK